MEVKYKYKIGQKVRLKPKFNNYKCHWGRDEYLEKIQDQEITILDRGFIYEDKTYNRRQYGNEKYELTVFYYIKEDPFIAQANEWSITEYTRINEDCLIGDENYEVVDEKFFTVDNVEIIPGETNVYDELLCWYQDKYVANCRFGFTNEGIVTGVSYNYEYNPKRGYPLKDKKAKIAREFLCYYQPKEDGKIIYRGDAAAKGYERWAYLGEHSEVFANVPDNYVELYVNTAFGEGFYSFHKQFRSKALDDWEVKEWLTHLGVYDKVKELYYSRMPKEELEKNEREIVIEKLTQEINDKVIDCLFKYKLGNLTEEEKEKIIKSIL